MNLSCFTHVPTTSDQLKNLCPCYLYLYTHLPHPNHMIICICVFITVYCFLAKSTKLTRFLNLLTQ